MDLLEYELVCFEKVVKNVSGGLTFLPSLFSVYLSQRTTMKKEGKLNVELFGPSWNGVL